ncbi:hypothetical protein [Haliscomenobacter hydrossis]|uniref:hypothetical protein n=1 Tax=Haliscomenobacter hydrossis TaxID=2350 RepID=UPI00145C4542|nr:hypothetical protein [Haliscomenobacter hydrossis]
MAQFIVHLFTIKSKKTIGRKPDKSHPGFLGDKLDNFLSLRLKFSMPYHVRQQRG